MNTLQVTCLLPSLEAIKCLLKPQQKKKDFTSGITAIIIDASQVRLIPNSKKEKKQNKFLKTMKFVDKDVNVITFARYHK